MTKIRTPELGIVIDDDTKTDLVKPDVQAAFNAIDARAASDRVSNQTLEFVQAIPSDTWTIAHNKNKHPVVTIVDSTGQAVIGDVTYIDANTLKVTFTAAFGGTAYVN